MQPGYFFCKCVQGQMLEHKHSQNLAGSLQKRVDQCIVFNVFKYLQQIVPSSIADSYPSCSYRGFIHGSHLHET